jgi:lon-related putative ATP-dependent protease
MAEDSELKPAEAVRELTWQDLKFTAPPGCLDFATTDEVQVQGDWIGQERALAALELGLNVRHAGFNIYVCGLEGTHRDQVLADLLRRFTGNLPTPGDRVLVQNFKNRDRPRALYLPAGWGVRLRDDMREMIEELRRVLPRTFREESFEEEKERISEQFGEQGEAINRQLAEHAAQAGFALQPGPSGEVMFIPLKDGRPMEPPELEALTQEEQADLRRRQRELSRELKAVLRQQRALFGRLTREVKSAARRVAGEVVTPLVEELTERYPNEELRGYLAEVREHILDELNSFQEQKPQSAMPLPFMMPGGPSEEEPWLDYEVNVLVDNSHLEGAPIIIEPLPMYKNLFGAVERMVDRYGKLVTNFTRVTAGSLLRAHGGCLIINVIDALMEPLVWRGLKRTLKTRQFEIETYDPFALFATTTLRPEPMDMDTRVVLIGPTDIFQLLYFRDEEFAQIFKVRADFGFDTEGDAARRNFVAQVAHIAREDGLPALTSDAVESLMEFAARSVGDRRKLPSQWGDLGDIMREAAFWSRKNGRDRTTRDDVVQAVEQHNFRLNRIEEKVRELIRDKVLLVDVDGRRVGQVNGLAVLDLGGYQFGRPSRITAAVSMGSLGVIAVDREAKMSGKTYDKAVLIVSGYLRQTYAQDFPLSLSASLSFEQSYSGIEGDSASAAEVFALISSLSGIPLRQDLAVTGSVNQFGEIQPIGGVNEKIEGFFYTCREVGLTGHQGVVIPQQNVDNLVLNRDITGAVREGRFHIHPIRTIDEGLELLTGVRAGTAEEEGTIHHRAAQRLRKLAKGWQSFGSTGGQPSAESHEGGDGES